jgi:hypothetical protein
VKVDGNSLFRVKVSQDVYSKVSFNLEISVALGLQSQHRNTVKHYQLEAKMLTREKTLGAAQIEEAQAAPGTETKQTAVAGNHSNITPRDLMLDKKEHRRNQKKLKSGVNIKAKMRGTN